MTAFENLYGLGAETVETARPGYVTPTQALAGVAAASKLAQAIHVDVERSAVRAAFKRAWRTFYNRWLAYQTLHSSHEAQADPARVLDVELPRFVEQLCEWRDVLAREPGGKVAQSARLGQEAKAGFPWKPVLIAVGAGAAALGARWWWAERERSKAEERERLEAIKAQAAAAGLMGAGQMYAATLPQVAVPSPPAWPGSPAWAYAPTQPVLPAVPPGYMIVRAG